MIRHDGIVYGPVHSRRFGLSLGLNLSGPGKRCTFDCVYCFRGRNDVATEADAGASRIPSREEILRDLMDWLHCHDCSEIKDWTLAGNAEPTSHAEFAGVLGDIVALRNRSFPDTKITVLTNGMGLLARLNPDNHTTVSAALALADRPCLKLDAGRPETWRRIARPASGVTLPEWLDAVDAFRPMSLQTMLVHGTLDNTTPDELAALTEAYRRLSPVTVSLLTVNKSTPDTRVAPVSREEMSRIRAFVKAQLPSAEIGTYV